MSKRNADPNFDPFPFGWDAVFAPRTSGIIVGTNVDTNAVFMPPPDATSQREGTINYAPGEMMDYVGDTKCIAATGIQYPVFAGDD